MCLSFFLSDLSPIGDQIAAPLQHLDKVALIGFKLNKEDFKYIAQDVLSKHMLFLLKKNGC